MGYWLKQGGASLLTRYEGVLLDLDPRDGYQRILLRRSLKRALYNALRRPYQSDDYLALAARLAGAGACAVVDVGANIGATALPVARRNAAARVVAIDPHPVAAGRFTANTWRNRLANVTFVSAAIAPEARLLEISTCPTNSGGHRVTGFEGRADVLSPPGALIAPTVRLDELLAQLCIEACRLLKVDVEGFEVQVLESAGACLIPRVIENVVCEYGPEGMAAAGHAGWDLVRLMAERGYACTDLHSGKAIVTEADIPRLADFAVTDFLFSAAG